MICIFTDYVLSVETDLLLQGETDWKVIAIDVTDPLAEQLQDIGDVDRLMPGFLKATVEWFKIYKMPDGKPANEFAFNAEPKNKEFAEKIIAGTHSSWQELVAGAGQEETGISMANTKLSNAASLDVAGAGAVVDSLPAAGPELPLPDTVDR